MSGTPLNSALRNFFISKGLDPDSEGLKRTPERFEWALEEMTKGYRMKVKLERQYTEKSNLIISKEIPFIALCEHHLMPFYGTVTIAYIPRKRVVGMSKLDQLVLKHSRRLSVQERLTEDIATELWKSLEPHGVMVITKAIHTCKIIEGFAPTEYICSTCKGVFLWHQGPRSETLSLLG